MATWTTTLTALADGAVRVVGLVEVAWKPVQGGLPPCHSGGMFTYEVTATGPKRFQVSATGRYPLGTHLIDDFCSLAAAEAFAGRMREVDAGKTYITPNPFLANASPSDRRIDDLLRQSRETRAAAERACGEAAKLQRELVVMHLQWFAMRPSVGVGTSRATRRDARDVTTLADGGDRADHPDRLI